MQEPPLTVLIQFTSKRISQELDERFASSGLAQLRPPQGMIMGVLHQSPWMSATDIQKALRLSKSTVSTALNELVGLGMLEYVVSEDDHREKKIVETEKGRKHQEQAWKILTQFKKDMFEGLSAEEQDQLRLLLNKVIENTKGGNRG